MFQAFSMICSQYLFSLFALIALLADSVTSRVRKDGNVCIVIPRRDGGDDSPSILSAFKQCSENASVVFLNKTYHVERVMSTHGLQNVIFDVRGTLVVR